MKRATLALSSAAIAGTAVLISWLALEQPHAIRGDLRVILPRTLELTFLIVVATGLASARSIRETFLARWWMAATLFVAAIVLVGVLPPETHRIYYDEDIYQNIGQNILWHGHAQMCNDATIDSGVFDCQAWEYNKEPNAHPYLLSLVYRFTGVGEKSAHVSNRVVFALGVLAVYWAAALLFARESAAVAGALVYMLTPENLLWSATVAAEPGASTFGAVSIAAWIYFCRRPSYRAAAFAASCLAFASQFRPESGLVLPIAGVATLVLAPRMFLRRELWFAAVFGFILLIPHFAHLWSVRGENWGSNEAKFAMSYVGDNLATNARYYVEGREFPRYFSALALVGLAFARRRGASVVTAVWFLMLFGVFIPFYAGSYRFGADIRFSVVSAAPLSILAGVGAARLGDWLRPLSSSAWAPRLPLIGIVYFFTSYLPLVTAVGREAWQARDDHAAVVRMVRELPADSILLTHNPGMAHIMGQTATQASIVSYQPEAADRLFERFPGGVYFQFGFWCNVPDPIQNKLCTDVLVRYPTRVIHEESSGFYRYILYRLLPRPREGPESELTKP